MDKIILNHAQKIWTEIAHHKAPGELKLEIEVYKKMLNIFQVGDYSYFIFNPPEMKIEFVSPNIINLLGYNSEDFTLELLMECIHPDDLTNFINFEATVTDFWKNLSPDKTMKYKSRYNYRIRKKDGSYIQILQQIITIQSDDSGAVLRTFVIHTDISAYKTDNKMVLSFIGLDGEPSYIDVKPIQKIMPSKSIFTQREKEVLQFLVEGKTSKQIGELLNISPLTVADHRKNIYKKTHTNSVLQLVKKGLEKGWI